MWISGASPATSGVFDRRRADGGVLQQLITRENLRRYAKALACLADRDRQLIVLRLVRGLSCRDVADRLGMRSEAAVHMAVKRALQRLEKRLNEVDSPSVSQGFDTHRLPQHSARRFHPSPI